MITPISDHGEWAVVDIEYIPGGMPFYRLLAQGGAADLTDAAAIAARIAAAIPGSNWDGETWATFQDLRNGHDAEVHAEVTVEHPWAIVDFGSPEANAKVKASWIGHEYGKIRVCHDRAEQAVIYGARQLGARWITVRLWRTWHRGGE